MVCGGGLLGGSQVGVQAGWGCRQLGVLGWGWWWQSLPVSLQQAPAHRQLLSPAAACPHCAPAQAGGFVADGRVNGSLNLSRALGDLEYKQTKELGPEEQARGHPPRGPRGWGVGAGCWVVWGR